MICKEIKQDGKPCLAELHPGGCPTPLWNHHQNKHKQLYQRLKGFLDADKRDGGTSASDAKQAPSRPPRYTHRHTCPPSPSCAPSPSLASQALVAGDHQGHPVY